MKSIFLCLFLLMAFYAQADLAQWTREGNRPKKTTQEHMTPAQIEQELQSAEAQFNRAREMFNPWYTGPLITPSASMMPPGWGNFQPYIYMIGNYAKYNIERKPIALADNLYQFLSQNIVQIGITKSMDVIIIPSAEGQWQAGQSGGGFLDLPIALGWPIVLQSLYVPQIKFSIQETFPTGRYQNLSSNGLALSGVGAGSYQTQFSLAFSKVILWSYKHPMNLRLVFAYTVATAVHVKGFNFQGGGYGTRGTVHLGNKFATDLGIEWSINQPWVLCLDVVYTAQNETKFNGYPGTLKDGAPATVGSPYQDNLSLAPGIEYNWNENLGVLGGAWFSVYGRNSLAFVQGIFSVCWTFPIVKNK